MEEEETEEKSEIITLHQTGGNPDQKLVEVLTRAFKSVTVTNVSREMHSQRQTSTKKTIAERGRLDTISEGKVEQNRGSQPGTQNWVRMGKRSTRDERRAE